MISILVEALNTPTDDLVLVMHYGSKKPGRDIDLLALYFNNPFQNEVKIGMLDVLALSVKQAKDLLECFDPIVIEPLLKGKVVYDREEFYSEMIKAIESLEPDHSAIRHLLLQSLSSYQYTINCLKMDQLDNSIYHACVNLGYATSYLGYAKYYSSNNKLINLDDLMESIPCEFKMVKQKLEQMKHQRHPIDKQKVEELLIEYENLLIDIR